MNLNCSRGISLLFFILLSFEGVIPQNKSEEETALWIMSYNIRYAENTFEGIQFWNSRKEDMAALLKLHPADIIGVQEAVPVQLKDFQSLLPEFGWVGKGRDDGDTLGEYCPIFYDKNRFDLLSSGTFWLSETPDIPSKGWDAALNRIVTYASLQLNKSGTILYVFNTHFDHIGVNSRQKSAELLIRRINEIAGEYPVLVTGDFNDTPASEAYKILTGKFDDAKSASSREHRGSEFTFNGFNHNIEEGERIDYIFVAGGVEVLSHQIIDAKFRGEYPSDHFPVAAEVIIKK